MRSNKPLVTIIIPVVHQEKADKCIDAIVRNSGVSESVYTILHQLDEGRIGCPRMVKRLVDWSETQWVMFLGEDCIPQKDFLKNAIAEIADGVMMIGLNDQVHDGNQLATHWMCEADLLQFTDGELFHTGYNHCFCDNELIDIAKEQNAYVWAQDSVVVHDNPIVKGEESTEYYDDVYDRERFKEDQKLYLKRKVERSGIKLAIGFPLTDVQSRVDTLFFISFLGLTKPEYVLVTPKFGYYSSNVDQARNHLCQEALANGCTHLWMTDVDQVYHDPNTLMNLLGHGKKLVTNKVHRRWMPFDPIMNRDGEPVPYEEIEDGGLVEVDSTGAGSMLIDLSLLIDIEYPWFEMVRDGENVVEGEDFNFCRKVRESGEKIFVDCDAKIGHLATLQVDDGVHKVFKKLNGG